jgi:hypothetical protein
MQAEMEQIMKVRDFGRISGGFQSHLKSYQKMLGIIMIIGFLSFHEWITLM